VIVEVTSLSSALVALLVFAAFAAGFIDAIAGGGGLVSVPALLSVGLPPHIALGTNKGQAVFGATASLASFWRRGLVDRSRALTSFASGFVGSALGAFAQLHISNGPLRPIITVLLGLCLVLTFVPRPKPNEHRKGSVWALFLMGLLLGAYDGFFGPGTGTFLVMGFTWLFGDTPTRASANAKVVNFASNLAAVLLFASRGTILWKLSLPMAAANALGAFLGAKATAHVGDRLVKWSLRCVALALIVKLAL
jgi:uncharacterized protein